MAKPSPAAEIACTIAIKAVPNAARSELVGRLGAAIKIKLHAPPVEGRANDELCNFLSQKLQLRRGDVTILRGDTSRLKLVRITGLTRAEVDVRLGLT